MGNNNTTKIYLGPKETEVVARLSYEKATVITREQLKDIFSFDQTLMNQIIFRLKKKGILKSIKKGVYFYSPLESGPAGSNINEFLIPPILYPKGNYYVGYGTMYNYYGFTDQIFQQMYVLNTSKQYQKVIGEMILKMVKISPKRMYGLEKIKIGDADVIVSDRERTLVDLIYFPEPVGGLKNAFETLKEQLVTKQIDTGKFIKYVLQFPIASTRKKIGFILDKISVSGKELLPLVKSVEKTSLGTLYNSKSRRGKINNKWRIIENVAAS
jgi:predicted transcriptional regulator of viral defense system